MTDEQLPLFNGLPEPARDLPMISARTADPLTLKLSDLPAYGSPDLETTAWGKKPWVMLVGGLLLAIAIGVAIGLQPLFARQRLVTALERQIARGDITAAQTTLDRFATAYPDHPAMLRYQGLVALGQSKWTEAREKLEAQVAHNKQDIAANEGLAYLYGLAQIFQQVPTTEQDLRMAMINDWTKLFGYTIAGLDASASDLGTTITSPATDTVEALTRIRAAGEGSPQIEAALAASRLLSALPADRQTAFDALQAVEGASLPSFQAYFALGAQPALATADPPAASPPLLQVPGAEGVPALPEPGLPGEFGAGAGLIEELPAADGAATEPSPNLGPTVRGAGDLGAALAAEQEAERDEVEYELGTTSGMGPQPRVRPFRTNSYVRPGSDGTEETIYYADVLNIRDPGSIQAAVGEVTLMPTTEFKVKVREITDDGRRVVLEELGRAVFVWRKTRGAPWYWDHADPANDKGKSGGKKAPATPIRPR